MKKLITGLLLSGALVAAATNANADPLPMPAMAGPLTANATPGSFDTGFANISYGAAVSGLAYAQSNPEHYTPGDGTSGVDLSNGLVWLEKNDGLIQFYVAAGAYSLPTLGVSYTRATTLDSATFGFVPVGYLKLAPSDSWSIEIGKLPTLIGAENAFTFENMNIERGILWDQEPVFSRGVQVNYASGPLSVSVSLNDGFYSNRFNWISGLVSYAFDSSNVLTFSGGGNLSKYFAYTSVTYPLTNNSKIYDLAYTYTSAPWTITPYVQYQKGDSGGFNGRSGSDWGFALLASYQFNTNWSLAGRAEYETTSGGEPYYDDPTTPWGDRSKAFTLTLTPTYQYKQFYIRGEASYVSLSDAYIGFGSDFDKDSQFRGMLEVGVTL